MSSQEKLVDPWLWVFRLHDECEWWNTVKDVSLSMGNDLERNQAREEAQIQVKDLGMTVQECVGQRKIFSLG